jgi:hypothetical protein
VKLKGAEFKVFNSFLFQESWACMKIREQSDVIGSHKRGRKKAVVMKERNLQSLAEDYSNMSRRDYLDRVTMILRKEF